MKQKRTILYLSIVAMLVSCSKEGGNALVTSFEVPDVYRVENQEKKGKIETLSYETEDYILESGKKETKKLNVYLPFSYDEEKKYNVLYLLHGTDKQDINHINTWFDRVKVKDVLDNLIAMEVINPLIVVTPTFYSYGLYGDDDIKDIKAMTPVKQNSSNNFEYELRNDIIPTVESTYSTYAVDTSEEGLKQSRDHRAMAGLSNGARITLHSGMMANFDYISEFGIYSSSCDSQELLYALNTPSYQSLKLNGFYNASGIYDFAYNSQKKMYDTLLKEERFKQAKSYFFQVTFGYHANRTWRVGLYDSLLYMFGGQRA